MESFTADLAEYHLQQETKGQFIHKNIFHMQYIKQIHKRLGNGNSKTYLERTTIKSNKRLVILIIRTIKYQKASHSVR